eukprot:CAMPEP_0119494732 /NCGR_PEP_ID=MMETSP1344-20130328/18588_1 /TAXON_ID=236787 /ORGANISM="Florenciella parvula, Strain CCMP2471" /LENGTH=165 /DNA_ID=CAMNT_0007530259 /DNA_START=1 /DNA_END=498 /DNA_ORIENTATION=-
MAEAWPVLGPNASLCVKELHEFAADHTRDNSMTNTFGASFMQNFVSGHGKNHQVYQLYYTYFLSNALAERWQVALDAYEMGYYHAPDSQLGQILGPTAQWIRSQLSANGCMHCGRALTPIIEGMVENNDHDVGVCSSISGNFNTVDMTLRGLVGHMSSTFTKPTV